MKKTILSAAVATLLVLVGGAPALATEITEQNPTYVLAVWETGEQPDDTWPEGGQKLYLSVETQDADLNALDGKLDPCTDYQIDLYNSSETTTALIRGGVLNGPNNPQEDLAWEALKTPWKYVDNDQSAEACQPVVVTPHVLPAPPTPKDVCGLVNDHYGLPVNTADIAYSRDGQDIIATIVSDAEWDAIPAGWVVESDTTARYALNPALFTNEPCTDKPSREDDVTVSEGTWECNDTTVDVTTTTVSYDYTWENEAWVESVASSQVVTQRELTQVESQKDCIQPTLAGTFVNPVCVDDAAYLVGNIVLNDPSVISTGDEATVSLTDGTHTYTYPGTYPIGPGFNELWPGASVDSSGRGVTWPGYITNADGTYTATDDPAYFGWTRGDNVQVHIVVNPEVFIDVSYPLSTPDCLTSPPAPKPPVPALAVTGGRQLSPLYPIGGALAVALGALAVVFAARARQQKQ